MIPILLWLLDHLLTIGLAVWITLWVITILEYP